MARDTWYPYTVLGDSHGEGLGMREAGQRSLQDLQRAREVLTMGLLGDGLAGGIAGGWDRGQVLCGGAGKGVRDPGGLRAQHLIPQ